MNYAFFKLTVGVIATLGLYSILYRETKFYRLFEHIFLGWRPVGLWSLCGRRLSASNGGISWSAPHQMG